MYMNYIQGEIPYQWHVEVCGQYTVNMLTEQLPIETYMGSVSKGDKDLTPAWAGLKGDKF